MASSLPHQLEFFWTWHLQSQTLHPNLAFWSSNISPCPGLLAWCCYSHFPSGSPPDFHHFIPWASVMLDWQPAWPPKPSVHTLKMGWSGHRGSGGPTAGIPAVGPVRGFWETGKRQTRPRPTGEAVEDIHALGSLMQWLRLWAVRAGPSQRARCSPLLEKPPVIDLFIPSLLPVTSFLWTTSSPHRRDGISAAPLMMTLKVEGDVEATAAAKHPSAPEQ